MLGELLKPTIEEAIQNKNFRALREGLVEIPAQDLAELLSELEETSRGIVFRLLPRDLMMEVFENLEVEEQEELLTTLSKGNVQYLLENMSPDDRTHLLEDMPAEVTKKILRLLSSEERKIATRLLFYPEDSVGRMMTPELIELNLEMTAAQALDKIRRIGMDKETLYSCYVTDKGGYLIGLVTLKNLVLAPTDKKVQELMEPDPVKVNVYTDQEEVIQICQKYDLLAVPVVDPEDKLIGIVTIDDIMDVKDEEVTEDIHMMAAVVPVEERYLRVSPFQMVWRRGIWLFLLLIAETVTGSVIKSYESFLQGENIWMAFFIPMLIATGGNTGSQSAMMVVRALAIGDLDVSHFLRALFKESYTGALLALALCPIMFVIAYVMALDPVHSIILAVSLTLIVTIANVMGTLLPLLFKALRLDPALMSGPFISTLMDITGIFIYFNSAILISHLLTS